MRSVFLSIGSNVEPARSIPACLETLGKKFQIKAVSSIYETAPVGPAGNTNFWNLAVEILTGLDKENLTLELRQIEESLGRKRDKANKFAPRTIDLDILPQVDYQKQAFIMIPLAEIAPGTKDPETGLTFEKLAEPLLPQSWDFRKVNASEFLG